jgi:hypothetical protein
MNETAGGHMRLFYNLLLVLSVIALFTFCVPQVVQAEENASQGFVDLDGDGFDDNLADSDEDGIPDKAEGKESEEESDNGSEGLVASLNPINVSGDFKIDNLLPNSERFGKRKFNCRDQSCFRGGFDAGQDFGPGNGISSAAVAGGCTGGVCQ